MPHSSKSKLSACYQTAGCLGSVLLSLAKSTVCAGIGLCVCSTPVGLRSEQRACYSYSLTQEPSGQFVRVKSHSRNS